MPPFPTEQVLDIQSDKTLTDARLQSTVELQDAAAIRKLIMDWDEPATVDRVVKFTDPGRDAEVAYKHEVAAGQAGWKEVLLTATQLDSVNDGIQPAIVFALSGLPADGQTLIIENDTDGAETFTWRAAAAAPFEVQIGGDVPTSHANLASQIGTDSTYWGAAVHTNLTSIAPNVVVIRKLIPDDGDNDRLYGSTTNGQVVDYGTIPDDLDYGNTSLTALPAADPGTRNFGISRALASLDPGEQHLVLAEDLQYAWDADATQWNQIGIVVPVATSGSGGGTIGKLTMDEDKALKITAGVAEVLVDGVTMTIDGFGKLASLGTGSGALTADATYAPVFVRNASGITPATPGTTGTDTDTLDHPAGSDTGQRFEYVVPDDYAGGDLTILVVYRMDSVGTAGNLRMRGQAEVHDIDAGGTTLLSAVDYDFAPLVTTNIDQESIFAIPAANVTRGDTLQIFMQRIGTWGGETDTRALKLIAYQVRYKSEITNRARTIHVEALRSTDEPAPTSGTIGTDTDTEEFPTGSDTEVKFSFHIPDEWDEITPPALRVVYAMSTGAGGTVRMATEGEIMSIGGAVVPIGIVNADLLVPANTNIHRSTIIRELTPTALQRGDFVTLKLARRVTVGGNSPANFRMVAVTITFTNIAQGGFTTVQTEEKFLELGVFSQPADIDIFGDTAYPSFGGDFHAMDHIYATSNGKQLDVAYQGRIAAYQANGLKSVRIFIKGVGPSPRYKLKIYTATGGAAPIYDNSGGGSPVAAPLTLTPIVLTSPGDFAATTANEIYHVVVEAHLDNTEELYVSRPWVRHE